MGQETRLLVPPPQRSLVLLPSLARSPSLLTFGSLSLIPPWICCQKMKTT